MELMLELKSRNASLAYFSALMFLCGLCFLLLTRISDIQLNGVNVWFKPFKFAISIALYCVTMAWICAELPRLISGCLIL